MESKNIRQLPGVDHIRALAALLIVYYHGTQNVRADVAAALGKADQGAWPVTRNPLVALVVEGHTAVTCFMVLSGFIFTFGALGRTIAYPQFLRNRFLRIYPLYVAMLAVSAYAFPATYSLGALAKSLLFQANSPGALGEGLLPVAWAVAVEFQFYLLLPVLLRFVNRYGPVYLLGLALLAWWLRAVATFGTASARDVVYWTLVGRLDDFIVGIAAGIVYVRRRDWVRAVRFVSPLGPVAVLGAVYWFHRQGGFASAGPVVWYFWPTIESLAWGFFCLAYLSIADAVPRTASRVLSAIGTLSFSIYLMHYPVFLALRRAHAVFALASTPFAAQILYVTLVGIPLTLLVSTLSYLVVERPFLGLRGVYLVNDPPER